MRPKCIAYIKSIATRYGKLTHEDAEDIFSIQLEILSRRGFATLYSKGVQRKAESSGPLTLTEEFVFLKKHLKRRLIEWIRRQQALKRGWVPADPCQCGDPDCNCPEKPQGHHRLTELSDSDWLALPDEDSLKWLQGIQAREQLDALVAKGRLELSQPHLLILDAAMRNPAGGLSRSSIYDAMTDEERSVFVPDDGALVLDLRDGARIVELKEAIKKSIGRRASEIPLLVNRALREETESSRQKAA